jgi:hypothetical protein
MNPRRIQERSELTTRRYHKRFPMAGQIDSHDAPAVERKWLLGLFAAIRVIFLLGLAPKPGCAQAHLLFARAFQRLDPETG